MSGPVTSARGLTQVSVFGIATIPAGPLRFESQLHRCGWHTLWSMAALPDNVVPFPVRPRRKLRGCPQCGARNDVWQIGRLLWGYCERHEVRWVVANYANVTRASINRRELQKGLEFLSAFSEVSQ